MVRDEIDGVQNTVPMPAANHDRGIAWRSGSSPQYLSNSPGSFVIDRDGVLREDALHERVEQADAAAG